METIEQIREFTNQNSVAWLATAEGDQPHVRGMWMWFADETGFYFHTGTQKRLSAQLNNNSNVEVAFFNQGEEQGGQMVRITGKVEVVADEPLEEKLFQERAWLNDIKAAYPNDKIFIFRVPHGEAQYWDMSRNCREKDFAPIIF
jgi:pyridoxamine 5'-phosphate oxidase